MKISTDRAEVVKEARRLARGTRNDQRRLLLVGYQSEFENRLPVLVNGKLGTILPKFLGEVRI